MFHGSGGFGMFHGANVGTMYSHCTYSTRGHARELTRARAGARAGARATGGGHTFFQESCMYISPLEKKNFSFSVNAKNDRVLEIWIPKQKLKRTGAPVLHRNWVEY
jgi:hypothetical protein